MQNRIFFNPNFRVQDVLKIYQLKNSQDLKDDDGSMLSDQKQNSDVEMDSLETFGSESDHSNQIGSSDPYRDNIEIIDAREIISRENPVNIPTESEDSFDSTEARAKFNVKSCFVQMEKIEERRTRSGGPRRVIEKRKFPRSGRLAARDAENVIQGRSLIK